MAQKRTWLTIVIGIVFAVFVLCLAAVGGGVYWFYQHIHTQPMSGETAAGEFSRERARFAGQTPLIEWRRGEEPVVHRAARRDQGASDVKAVHVLFYDPRE